MGRHKKKKSFNSTIYGLLFILIGVFGICNFGMVGSAICSLFAYLFGTLYIVPLVMVALAGLYILFKKEFPNFFDAKVIGIVIFLLGLGILIQMKHGIVSEDMIEESSVVLNKTFKIVSGTSKVVAFKGIAGGMVGTLLTKLFIDLFDKTGTKIIYWLMMIIGGCLFTGFSIVDFLKSSAENSKEMLKKREEDRKSRRERYNDEDYDKDCLGTVSNPKVVDNTNIEIKDNKKVVTAEELRSMSKNLDNTQEIKKDELDTELEKTHELKVVDNVNVNYQLPSTELLDVPKANPNKNNTDYKAVSAKIEDVLEEFGIPGARVEEITVGPACTQYKLSIKAGTKLSKITSINKEISLALAKKDVRIEAPIPGTSYVGIEIANDSPTTVYIREIMEKIPKDKADKKLLVALGKDIKGEVKYCEINKTPHLLVAGATGSGKSVCINCILASILMRTRPEEVKLVLVDPKKVELSMYNGVPHLLCPVVTDPRKAAVALQKMVAEMEHRYDVFEENHVKNIETYNEKVDKENAKRGPDDQMKKMPFIVIIIDELADLMMVASKEVEDAIMRITQMARAAGMHLIVATQRPSTDVITGVIKANIPSRISFAVSSGIDSRTILDMQGAEKLLGRGDMLFLPQGENNPTRIQGAWICEEEIIRIADYVCAQQKASYDQNMLNLNVPDNASPKTTADINDESNDDVLYDDIVEFVVKQGKASTSLIQRRFKLGYNRAARIMDLLEERGIVGPSTGTSKPREVLLKLENDDGDSSDEEIL